MSRPQPGAPANGFRSPSNGSNPSLGQSSFSSSLHINGGAMASPSRIATASRAERFEDEKRRIIDSCFSKLDLNDQLVESYITHIRVQEDALYPSTPPPPDSAPDNKKPRLIIIAVRSTGRVRMHKARENTNGSFSIGKTWNLEDLSAIESFANTSSPPQSELEEQYRAWAGSVGFVVTISKPYYWQAGTPKEKEFFIASAVKIFRKYTKGQVPELRGFDEAQKASMLGALPGQQQASPPPPPQPPLHAAQRRPESPSHLPAPPVFPFASSASRDTSRYGESPGPPPSMSERGLRSPSAAGSRTESPAPFASHPTSAVPKPFASTDNLRSRSPAPSRGDPRPSTSGAIGGARTPAPAVSYMPRAPSQQSSHSQLRSDSPANLSVASGREAPIRPPAPPFASANRSRRPSGQSIDSTSQENQIPMSPPPNGTFGQSALTSTQSRGRDQATSLPPISTMSQSKSSTPQSEQPLSAAPDTSVSDVSTPGFDDPAAFAPAAAFLGSSSSTATAKSPTDDLSGPAAPPRSRRRPTLESTLSDSTLHTLRPAPLNTSTSQRSVTSTDQSSSFAAKAFSPDAEESRVSTLGYIKNNSDSSLPLPGLVQRSALNPSPLSSQPQTPGEGLSESERNEEPEEEFRPGLGPMIKKRAVADRMKKAALAVNAFKPRPGGAAEKILKAKAEREGKGEPDGVTGVVPRPVKQDLTPDATTVKEPSPLDAKETTDPSPEVQISAPTPIDPSFGSADDARGVKLQDDGPQADAPEGLGREVEEKKNVMEQRELRQPQVKVKRRSATHERYLDALGIDRSLLANKCLEFEMVLHDFGWSNASLTPKALANMEADLRREQSKLDAATWLSASSPQEATARQERENQVMSLLDKAIHECDEMDGLLTIYNVELSSLNEDIAYIEAQSQGLQVQAANQRNLHTELTNLVQTLSLDRRTLDTVRHADLSTPRGIEDVEHSLKKVYQAIITIDPTIRSNPSGRPTSRGGVIEGTELSSMAAVRQKQDSYLQQSEAFCQRLQQHLDYSFTTTFNKAKSQALVPVSGAAGGMRLNPDAYHNARRGLWTYSPLILFTKELNRPAWQDIMKAYNIRVKPLYTDAFGQNVAGWKRLVRKPTGDEAEILFTAQEREEAPAGGVVSSARKLTVKRSQTLAKSLRKASDERPGSSDVRNSGSLYHCEIFSAAMDEMAPLISQEQNFVVDLFHATSLETADFNDAVNATPPDRRTGTNLLERKPMDPDRETARQVTAAMDEIFGFFTNELSKLLDWTLSVDPIQGVGVMACLSRHSYYLSNSSQEFLVQLIDTLMTRLQNMFAKFVDEQIRAIEDTKVKIKKRKGVIGFMRIFPHFAVAVENTFAAVGRADYDQDAECMREVRVRVEEAYARINRAMFDSLKVIAKESPLAAPSGPRATTDDAEDKEKLNYNVLIIENMNHYIEEVDDGGKSGVLDEWRRKAETDRAEAMSSYVGQVLRRPLGKLLEFLDSIDSVKASHAGNAASITNRPSFSRKSARHVLSQYDGKEVRRGIEQLRARIEKHFGVGDDESICRALVALVGKECEKAYESTVTRVEDMIRELYPNVEGEKAVELEFSRADVQAGFRR